MESHPPLHIGVVAIEKGGLPKTQKLVLDASLLNTQHYKVRIKDKVEQSRERRSGVEASIRIK